MGKIISTLLFQPPAKPTYLSSKKYFWITNTNDIKIPVIFLRQDKARYTLLYSHGNAEDLGMIYNYLVEISELLNVNILAYDYSGYGLGGRRIDNIEKKVEPSEQNCYIDIEGAYEYLTKVELINPSEIILYGRSVGSGPTCYLARRLNAAGMKVAGVVLHSPFVSVCRVVLDCGIEMPYDIFPNVSRIKDVGSPTFIIHGTNDKIVPFRHGKALYQALPESIRCEPFWAENMGHNNIEVDMTSMFLERLNQFFVYVKDTQSKVNESKKETLGANSTSEVSSVKTFGEKISLKFQPAIVSDSEGESGDDSDGERDVIPLKKSTRGVLDRESSKTKSETSVFVEERSPQSTCEQLETNVESTGGDGIPMTREESEIFQPNRILCC